MSRRVRIRASAALVAVPVLVALASPGAVADRAGLVGVSADAVHWSSSLAAPLFDADIRWVPGDRRVASFYVRNGGPTPATLQLRVRTVEDELVRSGELRFAARTGGGPWVSLEQESAAVLLQIAPLPVDERARVDVRAEFDPWSTNRSERRSTELWFVVRLSEARVHSGPGALPSAGAPVVAPLLLTAAALVSAGIGVARRRRDERGEGRRG